MSFDDTTARTLPARAKVTGRAVGADDDIDALDVGASAAWLAARGFEGLRGACGICAAVHHISRKRTSLAFCCMKVRRPSTLSPMSVVNISPARKASSSSTRMRVRVAGSIAVGHN